MRIKVKQPRSRKRRIKVHKRGYFYDKQLLHEKDPIGGEL